MIDIIGMSFIPLYKVIGPFLSFVSLLLMIWGGLRRIVMMLLLVAIIMRYHGCGVWILAAFLGTLLQLAVSPLNWIDQVMQDVGEKVGRMLDAEASRNRMVEGQDDQGEEETTVKGVTKKYPWWSPTAAVGRTTDSEDRVEELAGAFKGKNTFLRRG
jgi:hypothetical protein